MPTAVADLAEDSPANTQLANASYPTGAKAVRWHPLVGIATNLPDQGVMEDLLFNLLINLVANLGGAVSPLNPQSSDLVVTAASQKNHGGFGTPFPFHIHAGVNALGWQSEGSSANMAELIRELLSKDPTVTDFQPVVETEP